MTTSVKTCFKCGEQKALSAFYKHPQMGDGHLNKCKDCARKDVKKNYRDNIEHYRRYEKDRIARPERRAQQVRYQRKRRAAHPEKYAANSAVHNAIRDGKLIRPDSCEMCGSADKIQAHHHDYNKPLDVVWLCYKCHMAEHGKIAA